MSQLMRSRFGRSMCAFLSLLMLSIGVPPGLLRAEEAAGLAAADNVPAKIVFDTEFAPTSTTYFKAGQPLYLKARAYNKNGVEVPCNMQFRAFNPVGSDVIAGGAPGAGALLTSTGPNSAIAQMGTASGNGRVEASCEEHPEVRARKQFPTKGETMSAEELAAEQATINQLYANGSIPPEFQFAGFQPPAPAGPVAADAVGGAPDMTPLVVGAAVAGGVGLAVAIAAAASTSTTATGSGSFACSTRTCVSGITCMCSGSTSTTCSSLSVVGSGSACTSGNTRIAWCSPGLMCVNGICKSSCP